MQTGLFASKGKSMIVYKLCCIKDGKLYPLYVETDKEIKTGIWLKAVCGPLADDTHVKSSGCGGKLSLRPGWHTTTVPWTDWIGTKQPDGTLARRKDNVWCECEIRGNELNVTARNGLRTVPEGYYRFRTNVKQRDPWIISGEMKVNRILSNAEVDSICRAKGFVPQKCAS